MYLHRTLQLEGLLEKKSHFLFGPRSTGKSSMIAKQLQQNAVVINLLKSDQYLLLASKPWELENLIAVQKNSIDIVVIDEIQRIPELLNEIHRLIEEKNLTFLLTGSSARKLYKQGQNLLAGRAWRAELFPFTYIEIPDFCLDDYLLYGGLPQVVTSNNKLEELDAYVSIYLKEEIQAEALVRKINSFSVFLRMAAITNGTMLNFAKISNDTGVPASTIREYYKILEDTLVGYMLPAWNKSVQRKSISTAKFYFFDIGVRNTLVGINSLDKHSDSYGQAFEHFIAMELRAYLSYTRKKMELTYWHTVYRHEVDFIVGDEIAIEVKCSDNIQNKHLKGLKVLMEENICKKYYCVCFDNNHRMNGNVEIIPWELFLKKLWDGLIV
tara:strand:- start:2773 stop:3921 length:1149 start_codon:yes stop_codon:yes gene_type:complete